MADSMTIRETIEAFLDKVDQRIESIRAELHELRELGHRRERDVIALAAQDVQGRITEAERLLNDLVTWRAAIQPLVARVVALEAGRVADQAALADAAKSLWKAVQALREARASDRGWMAGVGFAGTVLGTVLGLVAAWAGVLG